jgi:hypothetical protein
MKRLIILLSVIFVVLSFSNLNAQLKVGVTAGANLANVSVDPEPTEDLKMLFGFGFGAVLELPLNNNLGLKVEPMYLGKGSVLEGNGTEIDFNLNYLEIPVFIKYSIGKGKAKPYLYAGPSIGILLSAEFDGRDQKENYASIDFGVAAGAGIDIPVGKNTIFIEARYALGLSDVSDTDRDDIPEIKTNGIQIFAGFMIPLGK